MLYEVITATGEVRILAFIHGARDLRIALDEQT
jgi:hypothetical protein